MKAEFLQDPTLEAMGNYMTRLSKRQQVVSSNIANIDTPGYRTKDVSFHATMAELLPGPALEMRGTNPEHIEKWTFAPAAPQVFEVPGLPNGPGQNNVNIDDEMIKLGETSFWFSAVALLLRSKFHTISSSINEGRIG